MGVGDEKATGWDAPPGPDAKLFKGRERTIVHQITMGAALLGGKRFPEAKAELRKTIASNRDRNPNDDLRWSTLHLLSVALSAQRKFGEAVTASEQARNLVVQVGNRSLSIRVEQALLELEHRMAGLDPRYAGVGRRVTGGAAGRQRDLAREKNARAVIIEYVIRRGGRLGQSFPSQYRR